MMVARNKGLIVMVSSAGGLRYGINVAYGVGKEAVIFNLYTASLLSKLGTAQLKLNLIIYLVGTKFFVFSKQKSKHY